MYYLNCIIDVIKKMNYLLTKQQKIYSIILIFLTVIGAVFETLGVSIIIPLVSAILSPSELMDNGLINTCMMILGFSTTNQLIFLVVIGVVVIYCVKNLFLIGLSYYRIKYSSKIQRELSVKMMRSYMKRDYNFFLGINTSDLLRGIGTDVAGVYQVLYQGFRLLAEGITVFFICGFIMYTDFEMALGVFGVAVFCLVVVLVMFKDKMKRLGKLYRQSSSRISKSSYQAFQGIKEILVSQKQQYFVDTYERAYVERQKANVGQVVAAESPAYIIEGMCVSGLIFIVFLRMISVTDTTTLVPELAAFALAAFRILPSLGRISSSFNQFIYYCPSLNMVNKNLREIDEYEKIRAQILLPEEDAISTFQDCIELKDICWRYNNTQKNVLDSLNLKVFKGNSVAFIGASGAGKTTLADIILGLLHPQAGVVEADGKDIKKIPLQWSRMIGYVPQVVYLIDDTIRRNVAFGIAEEEINDEMIWAALKQAQMEEFVRQLPDGLDTIVGERGVRFSGGQRQRIAIARALYFNPDILLLDEATSALDTETETAVMEAIEALQGHKTLIIVAHRLTTIQKCDVIYEIANGRAIRKEKQDVLVG